MASQVSVFPSRLALRAVSRQCYPQHHRRLLLRHASNIPKPRVLEKPERFNPPSHPSRLRTQRPTYGAPLPAPEAEAQKTRQYPNMMPPEGTFLHWFLTNRIIHIWITLGILLFLTLGAWYQDFALNTPYADLLPPNSMFLSHPIVFLKRYVEVYDMHLAYTSAQVAERRRRNVEDVTKRAEYRKAHGLDEGGSQGGLFGGWSAKTDNEEMGPALREGGGSRDLEASPVANSAPNPEQQRFEGETDSNKQDGFVDFQGQLQNTKPWYKFW